MIDGERRYVLLDVFTDVPFGGNQLAVFPEAEGLDGATMQRIAREMNLSECAFATAISGRPDEWNLRIFTPGVENPFAGHPTIGAAIALVAASAGPSPTDRRVVLHEQVGPIPVEVSIGDGRASARLDLPGWPVFGDGHLTAAEIAEMLSLAPDEILDGPWSPTPVSCGIPYYVVPVASLDAARRCRLRLDVWEHLLSDAWAPHVYVVARGADRPGASLHVRMFPPAMGVAEDPATGSAAAALAAFLVRVEGGSGARRWVVEQGLELGRPSQIEVEADACDGVASGIRLGGSAVLMGGGRLRVAAA